MASRRGVSRLIALAANWKSAFALLLGGCLVAGLAGAVAGAAGKPIAWKPAEQALLRVDDRAVKDWNVYQAGKKENRLLLQIGARFLLIDTSNRMVFELAPSKIEHHGADLLWNPDDRPDKPLETSEWIVKDVGLAYRFSARLVAENHVIDVQIPHPLDIRSVY
jgi:hypothetical protein